MNNNKLNREKINSCLRKIRYYLYSILAPFDFIFRKLNKLELYPPIHLRRHVSLLQGIDGEGLEWVACAKLLLALKEDQKILDLACGCGRLELALEAGGWQGNVVGIDIHKPSIDWTSKTISKRQNNFRFVHANIFNAAYWPTGTLSASDWLRSFPDSDFDVILARSFFTHVMPQELDIYLSDIANRLCDNGKALISFFLLNSTQHHLQAKGKSSIVFVDDGNSQKYKVKRTDAPTAAVAYDENYILESLSKYGLEPITPIKYGYWCGRKNGLIYQDLISLQKYVS